MKTKIVFALDGSKPLAVVAETDDRYVIRTLWQSYGKRGTPITRMDAPEGVTLDEATLRALAQAWHVGWQGPRKETRMPLFGYLHG